MTGSAVAIATATESTVSQIPVIAAFAILFAFLVLILTTTSYVEPAVILAGLGVAFHIGREERAGEVLSIRVNDSDKRKTEEHA